MPFTEIIEDRNLHKVAWKLLDLLRTPKGAKYRLEESGRMLTDLNERSETLSVVTNAAHEMYTDYVSSSSIISLYYMAFKLIQALIIATSPTIFSLGQLQNSSKYGHGIKMQLQDNKHFPKGIDFWYTRNGMFADFMRLRGWNDTLIREERNNEVDRLLEAHNVARLEASNIFNVGDLLVRIPELRMYLFELQVGKPHYFHTGQGAGINDPGAEIYEDAMEWQHYNLLAIKRFIHQFNRPTAGYNEHIGNMLKFSPEYEKVFYYQKQVEIPLYNYWIVKLGEIDDILAIYFTLLYIFSILARYFPLEWSRMTSGKNSVLPLIDAFSEYALNGITTWVCNGIFGRMAVA